MKITIEIDETWVATQVWRGNLCLPQILRDLARTRTAAEDTASVLVDFADIGQSLGSSSTSFDPALRPFGEALNALADHHHEQLLKGETA